MTDRLLMVGQLGDLLEQSSSFTNPNNGLYGLYVPKDSQASFDKNTISAFILFLTDDPNDFIPAEAKEHNWVMITELQTVQDVIDVAHGIYPNASQSYLVEALKYFLNNDAYIE